MRKSLFYASLLCLSGCLANQGLGTGSAAQINIYKMSQICLGMSEEQVFQIMRYPEIDEQIELSDACYDIWFYITRTTALGQSELMPHNLTPLIFKDGVLVARGYDYYNRLRAKQKEEVQSQPAVSMSSKPKQPPPPKEEKPASPEGETESEPEKGIRWTDKDQQMIEQEQEQNFDYW